jgi:hypothetical protein
LLAQLRWDNNLSFGAYGCAMRHGRSYHKVRRTIATDAMLLIQLERKKWVYAKIYRSKIVFAASYPVCRLYPLYAEGHWRT